MKKYNKLFSNIAAVLIFIMVISGLFLIWYQIENAQKRTAAVRICFPPAVTDERA